MNQIIRTPKQLGRTLEGFRKNMGLTQNTLSARIHLRQATISAVENAASSARLDTLFGILAALNLEIVIRPRTRGSIKDFEKVF